MEQTQPSVVLLDFSPVPDLEYTALKMLTEADDRLRAQGITLWVAALHPEVLSVIQRSKLGDRLGRERMFFNVGMAVERYAQMYSMSPRASIAPGSLT
jgi:MFS superfamily sulfate permease-like transporter